MAMKQITEPDSKMKPLAEKSKLFHSLVRAFTFIGVGGLLAGAIQVFAMFSSGFTNLRLADAFFSILFGLLIIVCLRVLAKGKSWVIFLFAGQMILSVGYSYATGRGFNIAIVLLGSLFLWQLITLKQKGELV